MKIFYAHPSSMYGSSEEAQAVAMMKMHGYQVVNPSDAEHQDELHKICATFPDKDQASQAITEYFTDLCERSSAIAFSPFADGTLGADVAKQAQSFLDRGAPTFEISKLFTRPILLNVNSLAKYKCLDEKETIKQLVKQTPFYPSYLGKRKMVGVLNLG